MESSYSFETLMSTYKTTRCHNDPEDRKMQVKEFPPPLSPPPIFMEAKYPLLR